MATTTVTVEAIFRCSLERAFKTPMLCDVSKVHTGYGVMPRVTHCTEDEHWGKPHGSKKVFMVKTLLHPGGEACVDRVIERIENAYWKIEVGEFKSWMLGFSKFVGEWRTTEIGPNTISIRYTYTLHSDAPPLYPLNWLIGKTFWRVYMRRVLENIRVMAYEGEPYLYE
jgi:hypothetical protein